MAISTFQVANVVPVSPATTPPDEAALPAKVVSMALIPAAEPTNLSR